MKPIIVTSYVAGTKFKITV